jgi:hypothetical protein
MNMFRVGLIETHHLLGAACGRQAAREAAPLLAGYPEGNANLQIASRALAPFALRGRRKRSRKLREERIWREGGAKSAGKIMEKEKLEELRDRVPCAAVLEQAGFAIDVKESTRKAVKHRRGAEIVIVIHGGRGWFDPLSDAKGDVFGLAEHLDGVTFVEALDRVANLVGVIVRDPVWSRPAGKPGYTTPVPERWAARRTPWQGSMTWRYLRTERCLPATIIREAIQRGLLREGPYGSMWAAHVDDDSAVTGWEERGPDWRGFSTGGSKILFRLGSSDATRLCVTEAAIDAMSLAAFEGLRQGSLYLSTGGGWSPATESAVRRLAARPGAVLVAATDVNSQGETFAGCLRAIADEVGCDWLRLKPPAEDWNEALKAREREKRERRVEASQGLPHARRPRQG